MSEAPASEPTDIRAALEGAFAADEGSGDAPIAAAAPEAPAAPAEGQPRAPDGKFAPKTDTAPPEGVQAQATIPTTPAAPAPEAQPEPIRPPASWSAQAKADFATLPAHIQSEVLKRETDVTRGFEERASKLKSYEPLDAIIAPLRERLAVNGLTPEAYFRALASADEGLRGPNRVQVFAELAQQYGIPFNAQPGHPQQQPPQAQPAPVDINAEIDRRFQALQDQTRTAQTQAQIDAFSRDNLYFENVRPAMAAILQSDPAIAQLADTNPAEAMKAAYEQACWANPTVRPLMFKEQAEKTAQAQREAANAKVQGARQAAGSLTGSPAPGSSPTRSGPAPSIRDALTEAMGSL
jgi:hypothetical protein